MNGQLFGVLPGEKEMARLSRPRLTRISGLVLTVALLSAMTGRTAWPQEQPGLAELRAFMSRKDVWASVVDIVAENAKNKKIPCIREKLAPADYLVIEQPIRFSDGVPQAGAWVQRVHAVGCSTSKFENVAAVAKGDGNVSWLLPIPGTTEMNRSTQWEKTKPALFQGVHTFYSLKRQDPQRCKQVSILDTGFVDTLEPGTQDSGSQGSSRRWREIWMVSSNCGDPIWLPLEFSGKGVSVIMEGFNKLNNF